MMPGYYPNTSSTPSYDSPWTEPYQASTEAQSSTSTAATSTMDDAAMPTHDAMERIYNNGY